MARSSVQILIEARDVLLRELQDKINQTRGIQIALEILTKEIGSQETPPNPHGAENADKHGKKT